jgi:hypothetical protein
MQVNVEIFIFIFLMTVLKSFLAVILSLPLHRFVAIDLTVVQPGHMADKVVKTTLFFSASAGISTAPRWVLHFQFMLLPNRRFSLVVKAYSQVRLYEW